MTSGATLETLEQFASQLRKASNTSPEEYTAFITQRFGTELHAYGFPNMPPEGRVIPGDVAKVIQNFEVEVFRKSLTGYKLEDVEVEVTDGKVHLAQTITGSLDGTAISARYEATFGVSADGMIASVALVGTDSPSFKPLQELVIAAGARPGEAPVGDAP